MREIMCFSGKFTQLAKIYAAAGRDGRDKSQICRGTHFPVPSRSLPPTLYWLNRLNDTSSEGIHDFGPNLDINQNWTTKGTGAPEQRWMR